MPTRKHNLRYLRYRVTGWIKGGMTFSNAVFILVVIAMCLLIIGVQKLEDPYSVNFLGSAYLPRAARRKELVVTTAKIPPRTTKSRSCSDENLITKILETTNGGDRHSNVSKPSKPSTKKAIDPKTFKKYLPAIKILYTPKIPRPLKLKIEKETTRERSKETSPAPWQTTDGGHSVPDIYRKKLWYKTGYNDTLNRMLRNVKSASTATETIREPDHWRTVVKSGGKVLAYSAYWDDRFENPNVRAMVIMLTKRSPTIYCRMVMSDGSTIDATGSKKIMNEHWRLKYASYFVSCPLSKDHTPPVTVSLSTDVLHKQAAVLPVHNNKLDTSSPRGEIAVCVKPLHYNYDRATWLVEFLELHRLLGVSHFIFYNHTVGPNVEVVLRRYVEDAVVTILPWHTGIRSQKEIRTEGIFSSLNDCLFRTMYMFKYVVMLDFDEYIIPRDHDTYQDLLRDLEREHKRIRGQPGSFVFRNTFFYLYWENDTTVFGAEPEKPPNYLPYLLTQYKTRRLASSMKPGSRSKYIVIPERAIEVGNHVVWRHTSGSRAINVPDAVALLHHYRICEFGGYSCLKKNSVVDQIATRFGPELLERVQNRCKLSFKEGNCPLSPPLGSPW